MQNDTLTFALDGQVTIDTLVKSVVELRRVVSGLSREVAPGANLSWIVEDLRGGSMAVEMRGASETGASLSDVEAVSDAWLTLGRQMAEGSEPTYSMDVIRSCRELRRIAHSGGNRMTIGNTIDDVVIRTDGQSQTPAPTRSYGSVTGRIQTISSRRSLKFTLYELRTDVAVQCYLGSGQQELMRERWGRLACVRGTLTRDFDTGLPLSVRQITDIEIMTDLPAYRFEQARGVSPWRPGDTPAEEMIRELRDAE